MLRQSLSWSIVILMTAGGVGSAAAQEQTSGWSMQLTPYVWATGVGGSIQPFTGAPTIEFNQSFSDLLEHLDGALFVTGYARFYRFVLLSDFSYSSSSHSGIAMVPGVGTVPAAGGLKQTSFTFAAGYKVINEPRVNVDLLGGVRAWSVRGTVDVAGGVISRSSSLGFADPILAARMNVTLASRWSTILYGDIGGFGAGSDVTGQLVGAISFQVANPFYLSTGYRQLKVDYGNDSGAEIEVRLSGPILGATWRF